MFVTRIAPRPALRQTAVQVTALPVRRPRNAEDGAPPPGEEVPSLVDGTANTALRPKAKVRVQSGSGRDGSFLASRGGPLRSATGAYGVVEGSR